MSDPLPVPKADPPPESTSGDHPALHVQEDTMPTTTPPPPLTSADWDTAVLPGRPRRRLLTPVTAVLVAALTAAAGFIGGVEIEKNQLPASSSAAGGRRASGGAATTSGASGRASASSGAAGANATVGQVANVSGPDLYVTDQQGNTIKVVTSADSQITRQVATTAHGVQPGDTVLVQGPKAADGSVQALSVRDSGAAGGGLGAPSGTGGRPAAAGGASAGTRGGASGAGAAGGAPTLFGP
jgi:hypothetical protein